MKKLFIWSLLALFVAMFALAMFDWFCEIHSREPKVQVRSIEGTRGKLVVAADEAYYPFSNVLPDGSLAGHDVELAIMLANRMNKTLEIRPLDRQSCLREMRSGNVDLILSVETQTTDDMPYVSTYTVALDNFVVFSHEKISSVASLMNRRVGILRNANSKVLLKTLGLGSCIREFESRDEAFDSLHKGLCECVVMRRRVGQALIANRSCKDIQEQLDLGGSNIGIGVAKGNKELLNEINYVLLSFKREGVLENLHKKWFVSTDNKKMFFSVASQLRLIVIGVTIILFFVVIFFVKRRIEKHARERIPSFTILLLAMGFFFLIWVAVNSIHMYLEERGRCIKEGEIEAQLAMQRLNSTLHRMNRVLDSLSVQIEEFFAEENPSRQETEVWLRKTLLRCMRTIDKSYINLSVVRNGEFIGANLAELSDEYDFTKRPWFKPAIEGHGEIVTILPHFAPDKEYLKVSVARLLSDGKTILLLCLDMSAFEPVVQESSDLAWSYAFFISPDGKIISRTGNSKNLGIDDEFLEEVYRQPLGHFSYKAGDHSNFLVFSSCLPDGWRAVVLEDASVLFAPVRRTLIENLIIAIFMFIVTFFFLHRLFVRIANQQNEWFVAMEDQVRLKTLLAEEAVKAEKTKSTFLATMSHEIRTPINSIVGFAEFLKDSGNSEADKKSYVDGILKSSSALLALINNILDLSKLESGNMNVRGGSCSVKKLYDEMNSMFFHLAKKKDVKLEGRVELDVPEYISLHEGRIRQVLINLIGNAVKFTAEGEVSFGAKWEPSLENVANGTLTMTVNDTGLGIGESQIASLFDPFKQDGSVRGGKVYQSTGLGLPISKRIVEAAGGEILFESTVNKGTCFTVKIPNVAIAKEEEIPNPKREVREEIESKKENVRIIIVDDVPLNLMIASKHVAKFGIEENKIETYYDADDAIEALKKPHDGLTILFSDVWMPKMCGDVFAKKARELKTQKNLIIFALTADSESESSFDVSVFDSVLLKPVTGAIIAQALTKALNKIGG